ncbi:hypothetical protein K0M31_011994 [Melipona bicolor]|uniref:Uncharacterized protein n=1 Tax=Melipona bicolor TaxID=60889 RepID=A0AA40KVB6_9HYME|nr:hypothetical protein K0M31_011994 [Melipona bicolor]
MDPHELRGHVVSGSSDEGESMSGTSAGGGTGGIGESQEMEENGSIRGGSNSASNLVYRDLKALHVTGAHDVSQDYNPQSRPAYQRGYSPAMDKQLRESYEKEHRPPSSRDKEISSWEYGEKTDGRKEYTRSRDVAYRSETYQDAVKQEQKEQSNREWVSPVPEVEVGGSAPGGPLVRARKDIPRGARFGPFLGKWASEPFNPRYAWEVSCIPYDTRRIFVTFVFVRKKKMNKPSECIDP